MLNDLLKVYPVQKKTALLKQKNIIDDMLVLSLKYIIIIIFIRYCIGDCIYEAGGMTD